MTVDTEPLRPGFDDVRKAARRIHGVIESTPVLRDQGLVETVPARGTFVVNDPDLETFRSDAGGGTPLYQAVMERLDGIDEALESIRDRLADVEQRQNEADER